MQSILNDTVVPADPRAGGQALIFLHIPKTAGTTLNRIIEWQYDPRRIFTVDPHRIRATVSRLQTLPEKRRERLCVVRGHLAYGVHSYLPQGGVYITMLRDPVARVLSSYFFILRRPLHPLHRKLTTKGVGIEDFLELTAERQNLQTKVLAGLPYVGPCDEKILSISKENLTRSFRVVGLSERFLESLILIALAFGWEIPAYENRKVTKARSPVSSKVIETIRDLNRFDLDLYEFAKARFEEDLRMNEEAIAKEMAILRARPRPGRFETSVQTTIGAGRFLISKIASAI